MKTIIHLFLCLFCFPGKAQTLSPSCLSSIGRSVTVGNIMLEENLGDLQINTITTPTFLYTQGSLQPEVGTTSTVPPINDVTLGEGAHLLDAMGYTVENFEDDYLLEFTLGEVVSKTQLISTNMLTQGILQPYNGKHWTGMVSTAWKEKNNWSPAIEPTLQDDVIIPPMCPNYPIIASGKTGMCMSLLLMEGTNLQIKQGGVLIMNN